jgi:hypothetical protein
MILWGLILLSFFSFSITTNSMSRGLTTRDRFVCYGILFSNGISSKEGSLGRITDILSHLLSSPHTRESTQHVHYTRPVVDHNFMSFFYPSRHLLRHRRQIRRSQCVIELRGDNKNYCAPHLTEHKLHFTSRARALLREKGVCEGGKKNCAK